MEATLDDNYLSTRPLIVVYLSKQQTKHVFCFVGNTMPVSVRSALTKLSIAIGEYGANSKEARSACKVPVLTDYYGQNVQQKLGFDALGIAAKSAPASTTGAGSGVDDDDDGVAEIRKMLEEDASASEDAMARKSRGVSYGTNSFAADQITFVMDYNIFPEDNFYDIKNKIHAAIGIPAYRQHLAARYGYAPDAQLKISYNISTIGAHTIDYRELFAARDESAFELFGILIDRNLYDARADIHVDAYDNITTIANSIGKDVSAHFVLLDLADWVVPNIEQIRASGSDVYQSDALYNGFVIKYFPQLRRVCFNAYINNERELEDKFPYLAPSRTHVKAACTAADEISLSTYKHGTKHRDDMDYVITRATVSSTIFGSNRIHPVNLRDMFDSIACSNTIVDVMALVDDTRGERARYELRKFYKASDLVSSKTGLANIKLSTGNEPYLAILWSGSAPVATSDDPIDVLVMIRPSGKYTFQYQWDEEDGITYSMLTAIAKKTSSKIVKELRATGVLASDMFEPVKENNMIVGSLTCALRWHRTITPSEFEILRNSWDNYVRAGYIISKLSTKDAYGFIFARGITDIDMTLLDRILVAARLVESNAYAYLSDSTVRQKWQQNVAGRAVAVMHRSADVTFYVYGIYEREFVLFSHYISAFVHNFRARIGDKSAQKLANTLSQIASGPRAQLRRLQELDPELYNLKKHGSTKVYAIKCQKPHQPRLYSEHETPPKSAVKYWNFTLNRPAYYTCPNPNFPHLNFIVNAHPKGYCLPCCAKMRPAKGSHHAHIESVCMKEHKFGLNGIKGRVPQFVMAYGHDLPEGRLSHLPAGYLRDALNRAAATLHHVAPIKIDADGDKSSADDQSAIKMLIMGVNQSFGVVATLCSILELSMPEFCTKIIHGLETDAINFDTIAGGRAATYFENKRSLVGYLALLARDVAIAGPDVKNVQAPNALPINTADFVRHILTDCAAVVFQLKMVYIIIRETGLQDAASQHVTPETTSKAITNAQLLIPAELHADDRVGLAVITSNGQINPVFAINADDYARSIARMTQINSIASRTLPKAAINIIRKIAKDTSGKRSKDVDLNFMMAHFAPLRYYIGMRGLCYAVRIGGPPKANGTRASVYIPVAYSVPPAGIKADMVAFDSLDEPQNTYAECVETIDAINKQIARLTTDSYRKMTILVPLLCCNEGATRVIGATTNVGAIYFTGSIEELKEAGYAKMTAAPVDPRVHGRTLTRVSTTEESQISSNIIREARVASYRYYEYELFCMQFLTARKRMRNTLIRGKISDLIPVSDTSRTNLPSLLGLKSITRSDFGAILSLKSAKEMDERMFDLDTIELDNLCVAKYSSESHKALREWLIDFMSPIVEVYTGRNQPVPTVPILIEPCISNGTAGNVSKPHCYGDKLFIRTPLESLCAILAYDLLNPLKREYILSYVHPESHTAFVDFVHRPSEIITITKKR